MQYGAMVHSRMFRFLALVAILSGCGSVKASQDAAAVDGAVTVDGAAMVDGAAAVDSAPPADAVTDGAGPRCDPSKPFAAAVPVANVNSPANDESARLSADELTLYFSSNRGGGAGGADLYMATRTSRDADFSTPTRIVSLASNGNEGGPTPTPDGLGLIFSRSPMGQPSAVGLYLATRSSTSADWSQTTPLTTVNGSSDALAPYLTEQGDVLYFVSTRNGNYDIFVATKQSDGTFGAVAPVTAVNMAGTIETSPVGSEDGKTLYFNSNRAGGDVWVATRSSAGGTYGTPVHAADLDTSANDYPSWLSADGCVMYLVRDGSGGLGGFDIWVAKKPL